MWKRVVAAVALALAFACFVWPTPWRVRLVTGAKRSDDILMRTNRLTGSVQVRYGGYWVAPPATALADSFREAERATPAELAVFGPRLVNKLNASAESLSYAERESYKKRLDALREKVHRPATAGPPRRQGRH